jgi:hypothetical protein
VSDSLEQEVRRTLERLDALDTKGLGAMLTEDSQSVDENTRAWTADVPRSRAICPSSRNPLRTSTRG